MDINMFFEFPGILISIGAVLLLLSIILLIIAFKTGDDENNKDEKEKITKIPKEEKVNEIKEETKKQPKVNTEKSIDEKKKDNTDSEDDGLDLTKVFEISGDKMIEKEVVVKREKPTTVNVPDNNISNNEDEEEEIELL